VEKLGCEGAEAVPRLYECINDLSQRFNPKKHIIVRAHANAEFEGEKYYIHGGSGWLMSRAYLEWHVSHNVSLALLIRWSKYHQDDTAQSMILNRIFSKPGF
jgi:hypothetical protein